MTEYVRVCQLVTEAQLIRHFFFWSVSEFLGGQSVIKSVSFVVIIEGVEMRTGTVESLLDLLCAHNGEEPQPAPPPDQLYYDMEPNAKFVFKKSTWR